MALIPHKITALAESDAQGTDGKNIIAGAVVSLFDEDNNAVILFDNEAGANGSTTKTTDSTGQVVVYVTPGEYEEQVNSGTRRKVSIFGNSTAVYATTADLAATRPVTTGLRAENTERANAQYILADAGYTALAGDVTAANGRVWALQFDREDIPDKFDSFSSALNRLDVIKGLGNKIYNVSAFTLTNKKRIKDIHIKYTGDGGEDFITLELSNDADFIQITNCKIDATGADDAIRGGRNGNFRISKNEIFGCSIVGIQITGAPAGTENENLEITNNWIHDTGHDCLELRSGLNSIIENNILEKWGLIDPLSAAIELQEYHENCSFSNNILINTNGTLFGIESAGSTARIINCQISNNIMRGSFTGISGKIDYCSITNNKFLGGNGNWRSGIEVIGEGNKIQSNFISNGAITLASGGTKTPVQNIDKTIVEGNHVTSNLENARLLYIGGEATSIGVPTCFNVDIKNNFFDASQALGSSTIILLIGRYTNEAQINNINIQNNTIIGNADVSGTEGIRTDCLTGSGTINIKLNTFKDVAKAVRINDDNLDRINIRFNDASQNVSSLISDASTTTNVVDLDNDI